MANQIRLWLATYISIEAIKYGINVYKNGQPILKALGDKTHFVRPGHINFESEGKQCKIILLTKAMKQLWTRVTFLYT